MQLQPAASTLVGIEPRPAHVADAVVGDRGGADEEQSPGIVGMTQSPGIVDYRIDDPTVQISVFWK
uniref:Uncharacterized protein n=1 Tax=Oryza nivara TaxID=4536 RepID=A0A0E0IIR4_ORYNI